MNKYTIFTKLKKDKEYQRYYKEASDMLDIAIQIADARKKKKLTQIQLARRIGMPQSQIARLERGNNNVTLETVSRVVNALGRRVTITV